jgi:hypothetical protein
VEGTIENNKLHPFHAAVKMLNIVDPRGRRGVVNRPEVVVVWGTPRLDGTA